ncbi:MAG: hypothetical protein MUO26_06525 [Methanotrichaceae archaeon]|nr:hypothetical protein [Methanotrichaceae archaeon]
MKSDKRCNIFHVMWVAFVVLLFGLIVASSQSEKAISSEANPDLIVVVNEDYLNRVIKADLEERSLPGVKEVTVDLNENEPIEVNAALKIGVGPLVVERNVGVEANISIENDTLKVEPKVLKVGFLNLPEDTWIGPIKSAMQAVEVAANNAYQDALAKGYKVTDVYTGNNTLTLSVMAPDKPF